MRVYQCLSQFLMNGRYVGMISEADINAAAEIGWHLRAFFADDDCLSGPFDCHTVTSFKNHIVPGRGVFRVS